MPKTNINIGDKFNKLEIKEKTVERKRGQVVWNCLCECGNYKKVVTSDLKTNNTTSCGCVRNRPDIGKKYGLLKITKKLEKNNSGHYFWLCECDCGNKEFKTLGYNLTSGNTQSCNCKRILNRHNKKLWKGYKDITGKMWTRIKNGAKNRNLEFLVTIEQAWNLFISQNNKCALSGLEIKFAKTNNKNELGFTTASLDRKDSRFGYTINNIQWVHKDVNLIKLNFNEDYFLWLCKNIYENNKDKIIEQYNSFRPRDWRA